MVLNDRCSFMHSLITWYVAAQEIATLRKEAKAFKVVRDALRSPSTDGDRDAAKLVFQKVTLPAIIMYNPIT
jgi:3'-phosphoadenosine 5'-phosphosulfate (PAPS) 3'-phosphatase